MIEEPDDGGTAFPATAPGMSCTTAGLSKREWMVGQILSNPAICHSNLLQHHVAQIAIEVADLVLMTLEQTPDTTTAQQIALGIGGGK